MKNKTTAKKKSLSMRMIRGFRKMIAMTVIISTANSMITPALALDMDPYIDTYMEEPVSETIQEPVLSLACSFSPHVHTDDCYIEKPLLDADGNPTGETEKVLVCGKADYVLHEHDASCYDENGVLVCPLPEIPWHVHSREEGCYETRKVLACKIPEHVHTDACYEEKIIGYRSELVCGYNDGDVISPAVYSEAVYSEPVYGDNGELIQDACLLEESRLIQDEVVHHHTDACYAQIPVTEQQLVCGMEEHVHSDICYKEEEVLICTRPEAHVHTEQCYEYGPEGESPIEMGWAWYEEENGRIVLNGDPAHRICGKTEILEHVHDDSCFVQSVQELSYDNEQESSYDSDNEISDTNASNEISDTNDSSEISDTNDSADQASEEMPAKTFFESTGTVEVTVTCEEGTFPEGTTMVVTDVSDEDVISTICEASSGEEDNIFKVQAVDISFFDSTGRPVEPLKPVTVVMLPLSIEEAVSGNASVEVIHVSADGEAAVVEQAAAAENSTADGMMDEAVSFEAESFSVYALVYTVDFDYEFNDKVYHFSLSGGDKINLAYLVEVLGILNGTNFESADAFLKEVESVEFSDESLVKVTQAEGDWELESLQAFNTEETLIIIMKNEDLITVKVTDAQEPAAIDSNLQNFLSDAIISGASIVDGVYVVKKDEPYSITLKFKESYGHQFDNNATLTYGIHEGLYIPRDASFDKDISIVSAGRTYRVKAHFNVSTDGILTVKFDETDPNFSRLVNTNNVEIRADITVAFNGEKEVIKFSDSVEKEIHIDNDDHAEAFAEKSGSYDAETGKFTYTIKVRSQGNTTNVNVKDVISGNALIFNNDVRVTGNSSSYTMNALPSGQSGFDYTFASMQDGEEITITYSANVDYSKDSDGDGKITADQTRNTVTTEYNDKPHTSDYSHEITYSSINKDSGKIVEKNGEITRLSWTVTVNPECVVSLAGSTFTDRINKGNATAMYYSGTGPIIKVYDKNGNLVDTRNPSWASVGVTGNDVSNYTYTFPDNDGKYKYVFEYTTDVDTSGVTSDIKVSNGVEYKYGDTEGGGTIGNDDKSSITKSVVDFNTEEVTWKAVIHVPYNNGNGLSIAEVVDTLPARALQDYGWAFGIDKYIEGSIRVEGTLPGETYSVDTSNERIVKIIFSKDNQPGLKGIEGGHDITITLKTKVDERWLHEAELYGGYWQTHINTVAFDGKTSTAQIEIGAAQVDKKCEKVAWDVDNDGTAETLFHYDIVLQNVFDDQVVVEDSFDTSILELVTNPANLDKYGLFPPNQTNYYHLQIYGGNRSNQFGNRGAVNYSETENGVRFSVDSLPKDNNGSPYSYYRISYYLKLKDGIDLEDLAAVNGGKYEIENRAVWNNHEGTSKYEVTYDALNKKLIQAATPEDAVAKYEITFNLKKATLNNFNPIILTDTLSKSLNIDHSSISC